MTTYRTIPLSRLVMPARPLRGRIDAEGVDELAASIREIGQLDPILVRPLPDARLATTEKRASVVALSLAETKSAGADERTWPTVAARICAEACGQRPPICAHCGRTATDCMAASVVSAKGSK